MVDFKELVKAGVHFGHQKSRWSPKMAPYLWGFKNNVHLIDVSKTALQLEKAARFLKELAANGKMIMWIGTKRSAQDVIFSIADKLKMPYVNYRWIGGTLSNYGQVRKSITKLLHFEDVIAKAEKFPHYTKKEINTFQKLVDRLNRNVGGIRNLKWPVSAIVVVDVNKEQSAVKEASRLGIPIVGMVDTNTDPSLVDYVIPANDDAPRSISLIMNYLGDAVEQGLKEAKKKEVAKKAEAEAKVSQEKGKGVIPSKKAGEVSTKAEIKQAEPKKKPTPKPSAQETKPAKKVIRKTVTKSTTKKTTTKAAKKPTTKSNKK